MTMILYGFEACTSCKQARDLLGRTPVDWKYVDVVKEPDKYKGDCPALRLETEHWFIGLAQITQYLKSQGLNIQPEQQQPQQPQF